MQVNSVDQSLGGLLGQLGPRRASAAGTRLQNKEFEACVGREDSNRLSSASGNRTSSSAGAGSILAQTSSSTSGSSVPAGTAAPATTAAPRAVAESYQPVAASAPAAVTEVPSPFAPSALNEPSPAAPWPANIVTPSTLPALANDSKAALADAMKQAGLDPSQYRVSYWEELVWYPAGNYINKFLTVQGPDGKKIDFDAQWTLKTPWVSATEIKDLARA